MSTRSRTAGARTRGRPAGAGRRGRLAPGKEARGLEAAQVAIALDSEHVADLATLVRAAGGAAIGAYQEPLGGRPLLLASLPLNAVQPTPFQRDLSPTHAKRLAAKIDETAAFLDPLIVVRGDDGRLWTPNGRHRLAANRHGARRHRHHDVDRRVDQRRRGLQRDRPLRRREVHGGEIRRQQA